ncbi:YdcF family protein [Musicola paradisiaca]|uniref:DUF218 domain-containing protein n=1 Tax=Musicola paradisiaca (strain Ech703) TaxID=579405 RepID=C6CDI0_MUSP7|nr:YdcF family protein [Musicola paradisiaca]ACS85097.1 protein of unknown function DUF218 [Musicola paradisiaca Ech703]
MHLSDAMMTDLNTLATWLAQDDMPGLTHINPDGLILAGHAVLPNILGALALAQSINIPVLLSGGIGHSTALLQTAMAKNPLTTTIDTAGMCEAEMLSAIAGRVFGMADAQILMEPRSRNCGENADFSSELLRDGQRTWRNIILVQDPLMQRRTVETFMFHWRKKGMPCRFISWPVFVPYLVRIGDVPVIMGGQLPGIWDIERYIAMMLGELRRLNDDSNGYGPSGAGFIGHVDLPDKVMMAGERLTAHGLCWRS